MSIPLGHAEHRTLGQEGSDLGSNIFTDIAFEPGQGLLQLSDRHAFVASVSGAVYQVRPATHLAPVPPATPVSRGIALDLSASRLNTSTHRPAPASCPDTDRNALGGSSTSPCAAAAPPDTLLRSCLFARWMP